MRALVATGVPGELTLEEVPDAELGPAQVLVEVRAISLNRGEVHRLQTARAGWRPGWDFAGVLTHVVEVDSTSEAAMRQLSAGEFETAVVAIGTEVEASILTTAVLADLGVRRIVAKAVTEPHGRILERVGAHQLPERADPFAKVGQRSVWVEVTSVVRASDSSFQVRWLERVFESGISKEMRALTGIFTIVLSPPRTADAIRKNPLGIYVHAFNWSPDVVATEPKRDSQ